MRSRFLRDLRHVALDFEASLRDWTDDLLRCRAPISILQGMRDPAITLGDVRRLRDAFADRITLHEFAETGFMLPYARTDQLLDHLTDPEGWCPDSEY